MAGGGGVRGTSACRKESSERVLMRGGARRRRSLGPRGSRTWARCEGATLLLSSSDSDSQGWVCTGARGSRSGMKAGFSIPAAPEGDTD